MLKEKLKEASEQLLNEELVSGIPKGTFDLFSQRLMDLAYADLSWAAKYEKATGKSVFM